MQNFTFKKQFGQNFIFDKNFLNSILDSFNLPRDINVVEIGAGMGTLSSALAEKYKKVISFEVDKTLTEHLTSIERPNLKFIFKDILTQDLCELENMFEGEEYYLIANLPYYITSQIVFKFMLETTKLKTMFVMVQKEVGERFCATNSTHEYGIPSVVLATFGNCKIVKNVSRKMFTPQPKVDSCIIKIEIDKTKFGKIDEEKYSKFVSNCFAMRRKTLANNLSHMGIKKEKIESIFLQMGLNLTIRPENLSPQNFVDLFLKLYN